MNAIFFYLAAPGAHSILENSMLVCFPYLMAVEGVKSGNGKIKKVPGKDIKENEAACAHCDSITLIE
jgi:hypothetical protein